MPNGLDNYVESLCENVFDRSDGRGEEKKGKSQMPNALKNIHPHAREIKAACSVFNTFFPFDREDLFYRRQTGLPFRPLN